MITYDSLDRAWRGVLSEIFVNGADVRPRGMLTRELTHVSFALRDASANIVANPARNLSHAYAVAEFLWILLGRRDVATIAPFNKKIADYADDGVSFYGAYGPWVATQLPYVVRTLTDDPDSRQAVMTIWRQSPPPTKDVPCTVALQFLLREGKLHAQTFMRSNDAWLGLPYDVFTFTRLQAFVAAALGVPTGRYVHTVGSLHLYERDFARARAVPVGSTPPVAPRSLALTYPYPRDLGARFETIALSNDAYAIECAVVGSAAATSVLATNGGQLDPWSAYLGVLAWKRTAERAFLAAPYDALIPGDA